MPATRNHLSITHRVPTLQKQDSLQPVYNYTADKSNFTKRTFDLSKIFSTLYHRKGTVLLTTLLFALLALLISFLIKPAYKANATIEISRNSYDVVKFGKVTSRTGEDREFYKTQYGLLTSTTLAKKVIKDLGLTVGQLIASDDKNADDILETKNLEELFLSNLTISPTPGSRLVTISFENSDPQLASQVTNTLIAKFIESNIDKKRNATSYTKDFLDSRVHEVKSKLEDAESRLDNYASNNNIIKFDEAETVKLNALLKMEEMLAIAEKENIDALANQQQTRGGAADKEVMNSPVVQALKQQKINLQADYQEMLQTFKPSYPLMAKLQKRIKKLTQEIAQERKIILSNNVNYADTNLGAARDKVQILRNKVKNSKQELMMMQNKAVEYNSIKREASSYQDLYNTLLKRSNEVTVAGNAAVNNVSIVSDATIPRKKIRPQRLLNVVAGTLLGLFLGSLLALYKELTNGRIRSESDLEELSQLPLLGKIPNIKPRAGKDTSLLLYSNSNSPLVEAFRSLRTNLTFAVGHKSPQSILLTSPTEGEGKSTTAINLACAYVLNGKRVLLIDADLRKPSIARRIFKKPSKVGLSNYLSGQCNLADITKSSHIPRLTVIPSGKLPRNPVELLSSKKMQKLIKAGEQKFDIVIVDSAPVRDISDAIVLSKFTDATLLTVQINKTLIDDMSRALNSLESVNGNLLGVIATNTKQKYSRYAQTNQSPMLAST